jgi:CrcB protein
MIASHVIAVAAGGATGAVCRFALASWVSQGMGRGFPYGTLLVNILGCFAMGVLFVLLVERLPAPPVWRAALMTGLLGGFTTFSAFSVETLGLLEEHAYAKATLYVAASVILCLGATWLGIGLVRRI